MNEKSNITFNQKQQWIFCVILVLSLVIGSAFVRQMDIFLAKCFSSANPLNLIDHKEAAIINSLEMGIMPLFPVTGIGLFLKMPFRKLFSISWKTFLIGAFIGAIIGTTFSMGFQHVTCGFID